MRASRPLDTVPPTEPDPRGQHTERAYRPAVVLRTQRQVAEALGLSRSTVDKYERRALEKLRLGLLGVDG